MKIDIYVHGDKETAYDAAEKAGLTGKALKTAMYLGYEHKLTYEVNPETGSGVLISVDDRKLA